MFEEATRLWVVHIGKNEEVAIRAREDAFVCIGWADVGDLAALTTRDDFKAAVRRAYPDWSDGKVNASYGQLYRFARDMKEGDPLVFPVRPTREVAIGRVAGPCERSSDPLLVRATYVNKRAVEWLKIVPRTVFSKQALYSFGAFLSVSTADDYLDEVRAVLDGRTLGPPDDATLPVVTPSLELPTEVEAVAEGSLYERAREQTEDYLLKQWQRTGADFEHVVAAVLEALGYTAHVTRASGDQGVDVVAHPDRLGLENPKIKVQAKSGTGPTGAPAVQQIKGTLRQGEKAIVVALGGFSREAKGEERTTPDLVLIDGPEFVRIFLDVYEKLDARWQAQFPLKRVFVAEA